MGIGKYSVNFSPKPAKVLKNILLQVYLPCAGCASTCTVYNTSQGWLTDGSGSSNYVNNANCSWMIAPINATRVILTFTELDTERGWDYVTVYE